MPTRKISERERLTLYARQATDEQLEEALEILRIEVRARAASKPRTAAASKKAASKKPAAAASPNPAPSTDVEG